MMQIRWQKTEDGHGGNIEFAVSEPLVSNPDCHHRDKQGITNCEVESGASGIAFRTSFGGLSASLRRWLNTTQKIGIKENCQANL